MCGNVFRDGSLYVYDKYLWFLCAPVFVWTLGVSRYSNGLGFEFRELQEIFIFFKTSWTALSPSQFPIRWVPWVKRPGREVKTLISSRCWGQDWLELYLYSPYAFMVWTGRTSLLLHVRIVTLRKFWWKNRVWGSLTQYWGEYLDFNSNAKFWCIPLAPVP